MPHQFVHAVHAGVNVHHRALHGVLAREGQQALDQVRATPGRLDGGRDELVQVVLHVGLVGQCAQVAQNHRQDVVEIVRQAAGQLPQGLHFLGLDQHFVRAAFLGDVKGQLKAANDLARVFHFRNERGPQQPFVAALRHRFVFKRDAFALQGLLDEGLDACVGVQPQKFPCADLLGAAGVHTEPVAVAAVDVAVHQRGVKVGHQRRNGVGDQAHLRLAALQRLSKLALLAQRFPQLVVGGHELAGALGHTRFQQGVLLADEVLGQPLLRDVGVQRHKPMPRHRHAVHAQHRAVGAGALDVVGFEGFGRLHPDVDGGVNVAVAVFAAFGVVAHEALEGRALVGHVIGEIQQAQKGLVPGHDPQVGVDEREPLVNQVQARLKRPVADGFGAVVRGCRSGHVVSCRSSTTGSFKF